MTVSKEDMDAASPLNAFRRSMHWRRGIQALRLGTISFIAAGEPILAFVREYGGTRLLVAFNSSAAPVDVSFPGLAGATALDGHGLPSAEVNGRAFSMPAHGALYACLENQSR